MPHPDDLERTVTVEPPLDERESEWLLGLAGRSDVRRIWPGQPGARSPWVPCADGCCLVAQPRSAGDLAEWLRFLLRELIAPRAAAQLRRAKELGLPGGHLVHGRVVVGGESVDKVVQVSRNRVQERAAVSSGHRTER